MTCAHESIGLSQDGSQDILCWGCGRVFGHLMRDPKETLVSHIRPDEHAAVKVVGSDEVAVGVGVVGGRLQADYIYPCAICGWAGSCGERGEDCHS